MCVCQYLFWDYLSSIYIIIVPSKVNFGSATSSSIPPSGISHTRILLSLDTMSKIIRIHTFIDIYFFYLPVTKIESLNGSNLKLVTSDPHMRQGSNVGRRPGLSALMTATRPPGPEIGTAMNFVFT